MNLKYSVESNYENLKLQRPITLCLPLTIRNFIQYLVINKQEWVDKWSSWIQQGNFKAVKNIILDSGVVHEEEIQAALPEFV